MSGRLLCMCFNLEVSGSSRLEDVNDDGLWLICVEL
jgi:hypothetical protein